MKILLIRLRILLLEELQRMEKKSIVSVPLGLGYIAAVLENLGHKVSIVDGNALKLSEKDIVNKVLDEKPDIIGISCFTYSLNRCLEIGRMIKNNNSDIKCMLGGPHFFHNDVAEKVLKENNFIDIVVTGEGEKIVPEILENLENGNKLDKVNGITYRTGNEIISNPESSPIENLDSLPFPAYHLLPMEKYLISFPFYKRKYAEIISSRGCPFRCNFCFRNAGWEKKIRFRSTENVLDELEYLYHEFKIQFIQITDDVFTLKKDRTINICKGIIERGMSLELGCLTRVDLIDDEILKWMKKAGFEKIIYGVESGSQFTLDYINKGINITQIKKALLLTQKNKIPTSVSMIVGFPHEKAENIMQTVQFAKKLESEQYSLHYLWPWPGTLAYEDLVKEKLLIDENIKKGCQPPIKTRYLSSLEIVEAVNKARFILRKAALKNSLFHAMKTIREPKNFLSYLKVFVRSVYLDFIANLTTNDY